MTRCYWCLDYHHSLGVACTCPEHRLLVGGWA